MNKTTTAPADAPAPDLAGQARAAWRLLRVGVHLVYGALMVALVYRRAGVALRERLTRRWSRRLLCILGLQLRFSGPPLAHGMVVANHISWLDIFVINAIQPVVFVSRDEVRGWPLIGTLGKGADTLFMERGKPAAAHAAARQVVQQLRAGRSVAVFPEGATSTGGGVLPFRGALLQAAINARVAVHPLALRYADLCGRPSAAAAYVGEMSLLQSFWRIAATRRQTVHCHSLPALDAHSMDRRALAAACEARIRARLAAPLQDAAG